MFETVFVSLYLFDAAPLPTVTLETKKIFSRPKCNLGAYPCVKKSDMTLFSFTSSRNKRPRDTDDELLASVAATGNASAFETLVGRYSHRVFALIVRVTGSAPDAEELTQDVMMRVYNRAIAFDGRSTVGTWIFRIAYNIAIDYTRRTAARPDHTLADTPLSDLDSRLHPIDESDADPRIAILETAMQQLEAADRALLTLYYYDSRSVAEIAEITHMTASNVKVRLMRLRNRLRESINSDLSSGL